MILKFNGMCKMTATEMETADAVNRIKNWPYYKENKLSPYGCFYSLSDMNYAFIPVVEPCELHATGFDGFVIECGCKEFKFRRRTDEEMAAIRALQESVRRESILSEADKIRCEADLAAERVSRPAAV